MDDGKVIKIEIADSEGEYGTKRKFELQIPCSDAQFSELTASIIAIFTTQRK